VSGAGGIQQGPVQFMPAKSVKDAEIYIKDIIGVSADLGSIESVTIANNIAEELYTLSEKMGGFTVEITGGETVSVLNKIKTSSLSMDTMAEYNYAKRQINLNEKIFSSAENYKKYGSRFKDSLVNANPKAVIDHEIAHGFTALDTELFNIRKEIFNKYSDDVISKYSLHSADEMVSEAFVHFLDYGKLPPELKKLTPIFKRILSNGVKI